MRIYIGIVTTPNRANYLAQLLQSIEKYKSKSINYRIKVYTDADQVGVHEMKNKILEGSLDEPFDLGFIMEDDIFIIQSGWEQIYIKHYLLTDYPHLSYYNENWHKSPHEKPINVWQSQGCLQTFTKEVIDKVGYFDSVNMGRRGIGHWDYSARCCRAGFNDAENFEDAPDSNQYIAMQLDDYTPAWSIPPKENMAIKMDIARNPKRIFVEKKAVDREPTALHL